MKSQSLQGIIEGCTKPGKKEEDDKCSLFQQTMQNYMESEAKVIYYESIIIPDADRARKLAIDAFKMERINEAQLLLSMQVYADVQDAYLNAVVVYQHSIANVEGFFDR